MNAIGYCIYIMLIIDYIVISDSDTLYYMFLFNLLGK